MVPMPTRVDNPNGISIGSAVFAGLTVVTDRPTDRPTYHAAPSVIAIARVAALARLAAQRAPHPSRITGKSHA